MRVQEQWTTWRFEAGSKDEGGERREKSGLYAFTCALNGWTSWRGRAHARRGFLHHHCYVSQRIAPSVQILLQKEPRPKTDKPVGVCTWVSTGARAPLLWPIATRSSTHSRATSANQGMLCVWGGALTRTRGGAVLSGGEEAGWGLTEG